MSCRVAVLAPVAREPLPGGAKASPSRVVLGLFLPYLPPHASEDLRHERVGALLVREWSFREKPPDDAAPEADVLEHRLEMLARPRGRAEVRQEQRVGIPGKNPLLAFAPRFQIDVG